ncbi:MAG: tRNA (N(6)-L-threonylcarbamoyladenosine(37)-C(2))-methylthiotransferase MtaB [Candidatus Omnitrophota bacterium]|nr:tRNA (N(6)-L-threonylcarbamoyladenosine(37)-C(2))-methylthiotransferase MtaB [Candidatus Omnitrophota bacterium]
MKTVAFYTLGCKVNQYETQAIREQFIRAGFQEINNKQKADIYVINTCTVTLKADQKSRQLIRLARRQNPRAVIIVTGCYVEKDEQDIRKIKGINFIVKNSRKDEIIDFVKPRLVRTQSPVCDYQAYPFLPITNFKGRTRAFIKIQDGCNQDCSYCKVRIVRGKSRSRRLEDIIKQARRLGNCGFKEIVLVGVHLGAYGLDLEDGSRLADVIESLEKISSIKRIRISSIDPLDITPRIIEKLGTSDKLCRHLHISLQSGDDYILRRMNRKYSADNIRKLIGNIRDKSKDICIGLDVIVGFPGEGKTNFANTLSLLKQIKPGRIHVFSYSERRGTPACRFSGSVLHKEIKDRCRELKEFALKASFRYQRRFLNSKVQVLVESKRDKATGLLCGYTGTYIRVLFDGSETLKNDIVTIKISDISLNNVVGKVP